MEQREEEKKYTEETLSISTEGLSRLKLSSEPFGKGRDDRGVVVTSSDGLTKKISSIMMGYNKDKIELENGDYVSWEEFEQALTTELNKNGENVTIISKKTGKQVSTAEMVEEIFKGVASKSSYITHESTDKISNQSAASVTIHSGENEYKKGIAMFGKDGLKLPNGEYLSEQEIMTAMEDYVKRTTLDPKVPVDEPKKEEKHTVIRRIVNRYPALFPLLTATAILISGFGNEAIIEQRMNTRYEQDLDYGVSQTQQIDTYENEGQVKQRIYSGIEIGKDMFVPHGTYYYGSSDYEYGGSNKHGIIGVTTNRPEGRYNIDYFSILSDGKIIEVEREKGVDLYDTLEKTFEKTGKTLEDVEIKLHIGGPVSGWLDVTDVVLKDEFEPKLIDSKIVLDEEHTYSDTIENFSGDTITVNDGEKDIVINVKDEDGNFIKPGTTVVGSDGKEYQFTELEVEKEEIVDIEEVQTGTKVNWKLSNIDKKEQLAIAAIAVAEVLLLANKKKKEYVEMTDSQIAKKIEDEYDESKRKFGTTSEFTKAAEAITKKHVTKDITPQKLLSDALKEQKITVEQIENISEGGKRR